MSEKSIADIWWEGARAKARLEDALYEAGVQFEKIGTDDYDSSLEIYDAPPEQRLTAEQQKIIFDAGFLQVFMNHTDKWETHYGAHKYPSDGWRVSYPHKRGAGTRPILVEKIVESWPPEWFGTGYVVVTQAAVTPTEEQGFPPSAKGINHDR